MMKKNSLTKLLGITAILLLATYLRIYRLDTIPNGLIPDEAIRGYDAYSLAKTGADSFGIHFPLFLRGYDDYVAALYSYLAAFLIILLDLSVFSLRLTSAFMGIITVALAYRVIRRPFGDTAAIIGSFLLAISPWHILMNRTGLEWSLSALSLVLVITLVYRGLSRPRILVVAGAVAGISLYGYSPIKAFLPILLTGFAVFYQRELRQQKRAALLALLAFILIAIPIYTFSFTPQGMKRFNNVYQGSQQSLTEIAPQLIRNYFSYFSPDFLFSINYRGIEGKPPVAINRLRTVGLLYWFELPLTILGLVRIFFLRRKSGWFMLYWLLAAPIGINLHSASPAPYLWLTVIPVPQALAGAGAAWLLSLTKRSSIKQSAPSTSAQMFRSLSIALLVSMGAGILIHFGFMCYDLFFKFPNYGAGVWFYGRGPAIMMMESLKDKFDEVDLAAEDLSSSAYLLFYTKYDPSKRHTELAASLQETWQNIGDYNIGNIRNYIQRPGCHLIMTSVADAEDLKVQLPYLTTIKTFDLPEGRSVYGLYAFPSPSSNGIETTAIFDNKIMLQGVAPASSDNDKSSLQPGQAICLIAQWQALQDITQNYTIFVHLTGSINPKTNSPLWAQHDTPPANGEQPTSIWKTGEIIQESHIFTTPFEMLPGQYSLNIGMYDSLTGERLSAKLKDGQTVSEVEVMKLTVHGNNQ